MSRLDFRDCRQIVWFAAGSVLQAGLGLTGFSTGEVRFRRSEMCSCLLFLEKGRVEGAKEPFCQVCRTQMRFCKVENNAQ